MKVLKNDIVTLKAQVLEVRQDELVVYMLNTGRFVILPSDIVAVDLKPIEVDDWVVWSNEHVTARVEHIYDGWALLVDGVYRFDNERVLPPAVIMVKGLKRVAPPNQ